MLLLCIVGLCTIPFWVYWHLGILTLQPQLSYTTAILFCDPPLNYLFITHFDSYDLILYDTILQQFSLPLTIINKNLSNSISKLSYTVRIYIWNIIKSNIIVCWEIIYSFLVIVVKKNQYSDSLFIYQMNHIK